MTNFNTPTMGTYDATWQACGYSGCGNVAGLIGQLQNRPAIVVGSALGCFDELRLAMKRLKDPVIFAVNDVGMYLPQVDHWVSLHARKFEGWCKVRNDQQLPVPIIHSIDDVWNIGYIWDKFNPLLALSGYFAMQIAYIMGASAIILCGAPGLARRRFFDLDIRTDFQYGGSNNSNDINVRNQLISEMNRLPDFKKRVRSISGWTREYFGYLYQDKQGDKNGSLRHLHSG